MFTVVTGLSIIWISASGGFLSGCFGFDVDFLLPVQVQSPDWQPRPPQRRTRPPAPHSWRG